MDTYDALEFVAFKIEGQAEIENGPLSDIEKKMLRFSEVEPGPLGREESLRVSEEFDRRPDLDTDAYEQKVRTLATHAFERDRKTLAGKSGWDEAMTALSSHDYYLLVMLPAGLKKSGSTGRIGRNTLREYLVYIAVAVAIVGVLVLASLLRS